MSTDTKNVQMTLSMSPALEAKLARLAVASESTEADVLLKAIALYEVALQAKLKGQDLAILDDEKRLVSEIDGI
jgi:predicted transcriptional regulator